MEASKGNVIVGVISLLVSAVLQAIFLCYFQYDWLVLAFTCIYAIMFLKHLKEESVVKWLTGRWSKRTLKATGTIVLFVGIAFLQQAVLQQLAPMVAFGVYIVLESRL